MEDKNQLFQTSISLPIYKNVVFRPLRIDDYQKGFCILQDEFRNCTLSIDEFLSLYEEMVCFFYIFIH